MRWKPVVMAIALALAAAAGCKQQCFLLEPDYKEIHSRLHVPCDLVENPNHASILPAKVVIPPVATVDAPERPQRPISLAECISLALENGRTGLETSRAPGQISDDLLTSGQLRAPGASSDSIRVLALNPAVAGSNIEASLSRFDAQFTTSMTWNNVDDPVQGINSFQNGVTASARAALDKPLPTGGVTGITFSTSYQNLSRPPNV